VWQARDQYRLCTVSATGAKVGFTHTADRHAADRLAHAPNSGTRTWGAPPPSALDQRWQAIRSAVVRHQFLRAVFTRHVRRATRAHLGVAKRRIVKQLHTHSHQRLHQLVVQWCWDVPPGVLFPPHQARRPSRVFGTCHAGPGFALSLRALLPTCFPSSTTRVPRFVARFVERSKHHMVWSRACHGGEPRGGGDSESRARRGIADGMARKVNSASKVQPSGAGGGGAIANSALSRANSTLEFCAHLIGPVRWGVRAPRGGLWCTLVVLSVVWSGSPLLSPPFPLSVATSPSSPVAPMRSQAGVLQSAIHHTACGCPRLHPRPHTHTHTHTHTHSDRSFRHLCIVSRSSRGGRGRGPGQGVGTDHGS
jgi:hypothetical protein